MNCVIKQNKNSDFATIMPVNIEEEQEIVLNNNPCTMEEYIHLKILIS